MPTKTELEQENAALKARFIHEYDEEPPRTLTEQLVSIERIALAAGMLSAADWIRAHRKDAVVWVVGANHHPVEMLAWVAKERKAEVITCVVCDRAAIEIDTLFPAHQENCRCAAHIGE